MWPVRSGAGAPLPGAIGLPQLLASDQQHERGGGGAGWPSCVSASDIGLVHACCVGLNSLLGLLRCALSVICIVGCVLSTHA